MNDRRAEILHNRSRWQAQRAAIYNEEEVRLPSTNKPAPGPDVSEDEPDVMAGMPKRNEPGSAYKHRERREAGEAPNFKGDLRRFSHNDFIYRLLRTTIDRDDLRFKAGWEIYNDNGKLVDWFYADDATGDPVDHAKSLIANKFNKTTNTGVPEGE